MILTLFISRESDESSFDWFKTYSDISDIVRELIPDKSSRILMLGCGNSTLSEDVSTICLTLFGKAADENRCVDVRRWLQEHCKR